MNITTSHTTTITLEHEKVGKVILPYEPTDPSSSLYVLPQPKITQFLFLWENAPM